VISVDFFGVEDKLYGSFVSCAVVATVQDVVLGGYVMLDCRLKSKRSRIRINRNFTLDVRIVITGIFWLGQASVKSGHSVIPNLLDVVEVGVIKD
jgi:hypothetical protein